MTESFGLKDVFPVTSVKVFRDNDDNADIYFVVQSDASTLTLESDAEALTHPPPVEGEHVIVQSYSQETCYRMSVLVLASRTNPSVRIECRRAGQPERIELRHHARAMVQLPLRISTGAGQPWRSDEHVTQNINSLGLRFTSPTSFKPAEILHIRLDIEEHASPIETDARVLRSRPVEGGLWETALLFHGLPKSEEDRLTNALLLRMLEGR